MHLIPNHTRESELADAIGITSVDELFADIAPALRIEHLDLPDGEPERYLAARLRRMLDRNRTYETMPIFLGGGNKPQHVPASVRAVCHRQELINAYTPYQPEVSQGLLQFLFEYQSVMADITRMEVVNSSMYDHASALGEAVLMAARCAPTRGRFLIPAALSWEKRSVARNYAYGPGIKLESYGFDDDGRADLGDLESRLGDDVCGIYLENPNHFGVFETEARRAVDLAHDAGALAVLGTDPTSLGVCMPPGELGADIVIGEGSCFGGAPALGGPHLGIFATREKLVRKMPGRLIGATRDADGKRGFVMTLQAREQHIRRAKATSNICTNEALMANQAAMHLVLLGRTGLREMGLHNLKVGRKLRTILEEAGLQARFSGATYNEVVTAEPATNLLGAGIHPGRPLGRDVPDLEGHLLWGTSPVHTPGDFEALEAGLAPIRAEVAA